MLGIPFVITGGLAVGLFSVVAAAAVILGGLLRHLTLPVIVVVVISLAVFFFGIPVLFSAVGTALGWGLVTREDTLGELRAAAARTNAIEIRDGRGEWLGVLPLNMLYPNASQSEFIAVPITISDVPPIFWSCAVALENARIDSPWAVYHVDPLGLLRAWVTLFDPLHRREGGSGLAEMVDRELRGLTPHPHAPLFTEFTRKWRGWVDAPAVSALYPGNRLEEAVATYLPLAAGAKNTNTAFGDDIHGVALAAHAIFGKAQLNLGEAAILAAAIKAPISVAAGSNPKSIAAAEARLRLVKARAQFCLSRTQLPPGTDLARARSEIDAVHVPVLPSDVTVPQGVPFQPERRVANALGGAAEGITRTLNSLVGPDWRQKTKSVELSAVSDPTLEPEFKAAVQKVESVHHIQLQVPLWDGTDHALIAGAVVNGSGRIVLQISNGIGFEDFGPQPPGSVMKIIASVLRAADDTPASRYVCPPSPECPRGGVYTAREAFGLSKSNAVLRRLTRNSEEQAATAFAAFGLPAPPYGSARYNAAFGAFEIRPEYVLRAAALLTSVLTGRPSPVPLPRIITAVVTTDGKTIHPEDGVLRPDALRQLLAAPRAEEFVAQVLDAPISMPTGTLHGLAGVARVPGVRAVWGKTGTAESVDHRVRTVWNVAGFLAYGHPLTVLLVVAGTNAHPLGSGFAAAAIAPLTAVLVTHAVNNISTGESE